MAVKYDFYHQPGGEDTPIADGLLADIHKADRIDIAVAWASDGPLLDALMKARKRGATVRLAFGLQHNIPHPDVVDRIRKAFPRGAVKVRQSGAGIFHPKVYLCSTGKRSVLWLGSMNATGAGFGGNWESAVRTTLTADDGPILADVRGFLTSVRRNFDVLTPEVATDYRSKWKPSFPIRAGNEARGHGKPPKKKPKRTPRWRSFEGTQNARSTLLGSLTWRDYYGYVIKREARLSRLWQQRNLLTAPNRGYFSTIREVSHVLRSMPAGKIGDEEAKMILGFWKGEVSYGHLGNMMPAQKVSGPFIADTRKMRSRALSVCRDRGLWKDVTTSVEGVRRMRRIPGLGVGIATRIGTIMRPDLLVSLNGASEHQLSRWTGVSAYQLKAADCVAYEAAMHFVATSRWYTSERPKGSTKERTCWGYRAALLDLFLYKPKTQEKVDKLVDKLLSPAEDL